MTAPKPTAPQPPARRAPDRFAAYDNPGWHGSPGAAHWTPPTPCPHPDDRVLGPCTCQP